MQSVPDHETEPLRSRETSDKDGWRCSTCKIAILIFITALVAGLASNLDRIIHHISNNESTSNSELTIDVHSRYDTVIIGAGATGVFINHFLNKHYPDKNILLLEQQPRIGGRSSTTHIKVNGKTTHFEHAAMRFRYQKELWKVLQYLDLCDNIFRFDSKFIWTNETHGYWNNYNANRTTRVRNYLYNRSTGPDPNIQLFSYDENDLQWINRERDIGAEFWGELMLENTGGEYVSLEDMGYLNDSMIRHMRKTWTFRGANVYNLNRMVYFRNLFNCSQEYYANLIGPFSQEYYNLGWDIRNKIPNPDENVTVDEYDGFGTPQCTLTSGYQSLIDGFYRKIDHDKVWLGTSLTGIKYSDNNEYKYDVMYACNNDTHNKTWCEYNKIEANEVILAIPPINLQELIHYMDPINTDMTKYVINSVDRRYNFKANLVYDSKFWIENGYDQIQGSTTDENIYEWRIPISWVNQTLMVVHIYSVRKAYSELLYRLQELGENSNPKVLYPVHDNVTILNDNGLLRASTFLVDEIVKQIRRTIGNDKFEYPLAAFAHPLGWNSSYLDGVYQWRYGYNIDTVLDNVHHPNPNENIYIAISSLANAKQNIWGAYESANKLLKDYFGFDAFELYMNDRCPMQAY